MNFAFESRHRSLGVAILMVVSGASGWALGRAHDTREPEPARSLEVRVATVPPRSATRRLDAGTQMLSDTTMMSELSCADEDPGVVHAELLERTLIEGTERERHGALTRALQTGIELPLELLQQTFLSDPSEDVRLLAFTTYVDAVSDDRPEVRKVLENGVYNDSSAVRAEALRRLDELERYERMVVASGSSSAR